MAGMGEAWQAGLGSERLVMARPGKRGVTGMAWHGKVRHCVARQGMAGKVRQVNGWAE